MQKMQTDIEPGPNDTYYVMGKNISTFDGEPVGMPIFRINGLSSTAVEPVQEMFGMSLYPNPAKERLRVELSGNINDGYTVSIYDIYGRTIKTNYMGNPPHSLDIAGLPAGVYILVLNNEYQTFARKKFVKH